MEEPPSTSEAVAMDTAEPVAEPAAEEAPAEEAPATGKKKAAKTPVAKGPPPTDPNSTGGRARRDRKQVEFFAPVEVAKKDVAEVLAVGHGSGDKLRDIPNVAFKMGKLKGKDELLENLHNLLFRRKGTANQRKKAVLDFSGFAFAEDQKEKEVEARRASLGKWKLELLHKLMDLLDLPRGSGEKGSKVDRVLEFLQEPKALSDVDLASKEASKKEKEKAKREKAAAKKEKDAAKKAKEKTKKEKEAAKAEKAEKSAKRKSSGSAASPAKKAKKEAEEEAEEESEAEEQEEEEEASEAAAASEEEEEEEEKLPAKKDRSASGGKKGKAAAEKKAAEEAEEAEAEAMEEDEQPAAKAEAHPSSKVSAGELKAEVEAILSEMEGPDLPKVTAKPILKKLEAKFGFSLKPRKAEVIEVAQTYVHAWLEAHPEAEEGEEEEAAPADEAKEEAVPSPEPEAPAAEEAEAE